MDSQGDGQKRELSEECERGIIVGRGKGTRQGKIVIACNGLDVEYPRTASRAPQHRRGRLGAGDAQVNAASWGRQDGPLFGTTYEAIQSRHNHACHYDERIEGNN